MCAREYNHEYGTILATTTAGPLPYRLNRKRALCVPLRGGQWHGSDCIDLGPLAAQLKYSHLLRHELERGHALCM